MTQRSPFPAPEGRVLLELIVAGDPVGKARHRRDPRSGRMFTPAKTASKEREIAMLAKARLYGRAPEMACYALDLAMVIAPTKGWPQWKLDLVDQGLMRPTMKPDIDNVEKLVKDALNAIAWPDDAAVIGGEKFKLFGRHPQTIIRVRALDYLPSSIKRRSDADAILRKLKCSPSS